MPSGDVVLNAVFGVLIGLPVAYWFFQQSSKDLRRSVDALQSDNARLRADNGELRSQLEENQRYLPAIMTGVNALLGAQETGLKRVDVVPHDPRGVGVFDQSIGMPMIESTVQVHVPGVIQSPPDDAGP